MDDIHVNTAFGSSTFSCISLPRAKSKPKLAQWGKAAFFFGSHVVFFGGPNPKMENDVEARDVGVPNLEASEILQPS